MVYLEKISRSLSQGFNWIAVLAVAAMMFLTSADVILRYVGLPISGTYEIVTFLSASAVSFALGKTTLNHGHVAVNLITKMLSPPVRAGVDLLTNIISLVLFAAISWESLKYAKDLWDSRETYGTIELPVSPIVFGIAFSCALVCLVIFTNILRIVSKRDPEQSEGNTFD